KPPWSTPDRPHCSGFNAEKHQVEEQASVHIFRHVAATTTVASLWTRWRHSPPASLDRLLAAGSLECALADLWFPARDGQASALGALVGLSAQAAIALLTGQNQGDAAARAAVEAVLPPGPTVVTEPAPEGLRFYGLDPRSYARAAHAWQACHPAHPAWVLGLRTAGSYLAPVVLSALAAAPVPHRCATLRPRGDPQARVLALTPSLARALAVWPGAFLVADEGPGLSGSSFACVVECLTSLGVAPDRIALLPSANPDPGNLVYPAAAAGWPRWRKFRAPGLAPPPGWRAAFNLSAGAWRALLPAPPRTPVWGAQERLKFLSRDRRRLLKFAGFGPYGRAALDRARALARAGWAPAADSPADGWILYPCIPSRPVRPTAAWCEFAGAYLAWVRSNFPLGPAAPPAPPLIEMLALNVERLLAAPLPPALREAPAAVPVALDGRMLRQEWGATPAGWVKFDGTDHADDPFFPGPADIAWDLAGLASEFGAAAGAAVLSAYCRRAGEAPSRLARRLRWHRCAYLAFRAAYCRLAAAQTPAPDSTWFTAASNRYRRALATNLQCRVNAR
ncbi:MAG TPA: hypothetical protein VN515_06285, partial [Terriglobales bacterium]|nr:hypothetical protein [Terriglobales bacterium]